MTDPGCSRSAVCALITAAAMLLALAPTASAQPASTGEQEAILEVIDRFMHAVSNNDAAVLDGLRVDGSVNFIERPVPGGSALVRRPATPANVPPGTYRERYWDPTVHVRGRIAIVWTPYEFWRDGKTSHCGIDVFELVKESDTWRIANMMWTVEPDACASLRPRDPSMMRPRG